MLWRFRSHHQTRTGGAVNVRQFLAKYRSTTHNKKYPLMYLRYLIRSTKKLQAIFIYNDLNQILAIEILIYLNKTMNIQYSRAHTKLFDATTHDEIDY